MQVQASGTNERRTCGKYLGCVAYIHERGNRRAEACDRFISVGFNLKGPPHLLFTISYDGPAAITLRIKLHHLVVALGGCGESGVFWATMAFAGQKRLDLALFLQNNQGKPVAELFQDRNQLDQYLLPIRLRVQHAHGRIKLVRRRRDLFRFSYACLHSAASSGQSMPAAAGGLG